MITALRSRIAHLVTVVSVVLAAFGAAVSYVPAAFAQVVPDGPYQNPATTPSAPVTTHVASGSGPATWIVVVIAVALIVVGAALGQVVRRVLWNQQVPRRAAVAS